MINNELSKPVAYTDADELRFHHATSDMWPVPLGFGKDVPLYSQEYVSALKRESAVNWEAAASLNVENQELKKHITELEAQVKVWESAATKHLERAEDAEKRLATPVRFKVGTDSVDSDVSDRNKPGMVVAVHVDAGDFVKVKGQVHEVKEACFDDHDVTLWFVCGEVLKCAAGCQIEVVSAPEGDA